MIAVQFIHGRFHIRLLLVVVGWLDDDAHEDEDMDEPDPKSTGPLTLVVLVSCWPSFLMEEEQSRTKSMIRSWEKAVGSRSPVASMVRISTTRLAQNGKYRSGTSFDDCKTRTFRIRGLSAWSSVRKPRVKPCSTLSVPCSPVVSGDTILISA